MRLGELFGREVVDADGVRLGKVRDVRLVQDGPLLEGFGNALRVDGLVVGQGGLGVRLGIWRAGVRGPRPLVALLRRREHRAFDVPWGAVERDDSEELRLRVPASELQRLGDP